MTTTDSTAVLILASTWARARNSRVSPREEGAFRALNELPTALHPPAWVVMQMGSLAGAITIGIIDRRHNRHPAAALAGTATWAGIKVMKHAVGRRGRPSDHLDHVIVRGQAQRGLGWPSGHAAVSTVIATVAGRGRCRAHRVLLGVGSLVTGASRTYVGAHLPLDVVGGWAAGVLASRLTGRVATSLGQPMQRSGRTRGR